MYGCTMDVTKRALADKWSAPRQARFTESPFQWMADKWAKARMANRLMMFLTCVNPDHLDDLLAECEVRDAVRTCMTEHTSGTGVEVVQATITTVRREQNYELSRATDFLFERHSFEEWQTLLQESGLTDEEAVALRNQSKQVKLIPRFAAASIVALRSKFGVMAPTEANVLLIQREYLRVCRESHVRASDTELHRQYVMNGYFSEDVLSRLATVRTRVPAWMRAAYGSVGSTGGPQTC